MLDHRGFIAETNATHLFFAYQNCLYTSRDVACPEGITRATVLDLCRKHDLPCIEKDASLTELYRADEAFCTGTMGELAAVTEVDGRTIGNGQVGPMTQRLTGLYKELTATEGVQVA